MRRTHASSYTNSHYTLAGQGGVTLLEIVVVLMILGAIAAISVPRLPSGLLGAPQELTAAQDRLISQARLARDRVLGCGIERRLEVVTTPGPGGDVVFDTGETPCDAPFTFELTDSITLAVTQGSASFLFRYPEGRIRNDDGELGENQEWTLSADGGAFQERVCVQAATGRIERGSCS